MTIAYDAKLKRPGCAILQAAFGCTIGIANHFPAENWLMAPTPNMQVYTVTPDQLQYLINLNPTTSR